MLGRIAFGKPPDFIRALPEDAVVVSLKDLTKSAGLKNVVSGHDPVIMIHAGSGDGLVCRAGNRYICLGFPRESLPVLDKQDSLFALERVAFSFQDWGAKEILRNARLRGTSPQHENLPPDLWSPTPAEREWLVWTEQAVMNGRLTYKPRGGPVTPKERPKLFAAYLLSRQESLDAALVEITEDTAPGF